MIQASLPEYRCDIIWHCVILKCTSGQHMTSRHISLHSLTLQGIVLLHVTLNSMASHDITWHPVDLLYIWSHYIGTLDIELHYIKFRDATLRYVTFHYITVQYILLPDVTWPYRRLRPLASRFSWLVLRNKNSNRLAHLNMMPTCSAFLFVNSTVASSIMNTTYYVDVFECLSRMVGNIYLYICLYVLIYIYIYVYIHGYIYIYIYIYIYRYVCIYICIYIYMCVCVCETILNIISLGSMRVRASQLSGTYSTWHYMTSHDKIWHDTKLKCMVWRVLTQHDITDINPTIVCYIMNNSIFSYFRWT